MWELSSASEATMASPRSNCQTTTPASQSTFNLLPLAVRGYYLSRMATL